MEREADRTDVVDLRDQEGDLVEALDIIGIIAKKAPIFITKKEFEELGEFTLIMEYELDGLSIYYSEEGYE